MAVGKQKPKGTLDAHSLVEKAQALSTRPKHSKNKTGFKAKSDAYLNQVPILGDKGVIYTAPQSGGKYYVPNMDTRRKEVLPKVITNH